MGEIQDIEWIQTHKHIDILITDQVFVPVPTMAGVHLWSCVTQEKLKCWWLPLGVTDFPFQFSNFSIMYLNYFYRENKKLLVKEYPFRTETNVVAPRYWGASHTGWRSMLPLLHHTPEQSMLIACYGPKPLRVGSSFSEQWENSQHFSGTALHGHSAEQKAGAVEARPSQHLCLVSIAHHAHFPG